MWNRIIYNGPPSRPQHVAFYAMQDEGCLLFPRSSKGTLLRDLRRDAEHTIAPSREYCIGSNTHLLHTTVILISPISQSYVHTTELYDFNNQHLFVCEHYYL